MELIDALDAAGDEFGRRLALVADTDWTRSTPCPEWDLRFLVAHVVGGNRFSVMILSGMSASDAIDRVMATSQLGDDSMAAWTTTSAEQVEAFRANSVMERLVDHPLGEITGREFLAFRVVDIALHAWDLARSLGTDDQIEPELIDVVLEFVRRGPTGMGFGIGALGVVDGSASPQQTLLDLMGRRAE